MDAVNDNTSVLIRTDYVKERWHPIKDLIWFTMGDEAVTDAEMIEALNHPVNPDEAREVKARALQQSPPPDGVGVRACEMYQTWSSRSTHLRRIAWFINLYRDMSDETFESTMRQYPLSIDFGIPGTRARFLVHDGNHRLAAAIYLNKPVVAADCGGVIEQVAFGTTTTSPRC